MLQAFQWILTLIRCSTPYGENNWAFSFIQLSLTWQSHPLGSILPSLSSSMWLMRRTMAAFSSMARSLALTASATISCHSRTWLWVSSALPDSLACGQKEERETGQQWEFPTGFISYTLQAGENTEESWRPERQPSWWTAPGLLVVSFVAPHIPQV